MAKIAVDVVLLPSERIVDKAIEANRELLKQCPDKIILDKENCLPHVSLAMGCIEETDSPGIKNILPPLNLIPTKFWITFLIFSCAKTTSARPLIY